MAANSGDIVPTLLLAAAGRTVVRGDGWAHGWSEESYRRSPKAAIPLDSDRSIRLSAEAVRHYEAAVQTLVKVPVTRSLYDLQELWGIVAGMLASLPLESPREAMRSDLEESVTRLLAPPESVVAFPVANVKWDASPLRLGAVIIGRVDERIIAEAGVPIFAGSDPDDTWWLQLGSRTDRPVVFVRRSHAQRKRAVDQAIEALDDLVGVALFLEPDLDARSLLGGRGDAHRPGMRGLVVDRRAAGKVTRMERELVAFCYQRDGTGEAVSRHRWGQGPFPLDDLLRDAGRQRLATDILEARFSILRRLRVAARWHAEAFWSKPDDHALVALGIAFDALLGEEGGSPGRVLAERFALLEENTDTRREKHELFGKRIYPACSTVAHGGRSSVLDEGSFRRDVARELRWAGARLHELATRHGLGSEEDHRRLFDELKWGLK